MSVTTITTRGKPKAWAWSYSKLKNFESCPKRHWHLDIAKDIKEEEGESLLYGNNLHKAIALAIERKQELSAGFVKLQPWVDKVHVSPAAALTNPDLMPRLLVEQQLAINADFGPTGWFDADAWYRGIADVIKIMGPVAVVLDWKTGKILEDGVQLALMAACVFAHHPGIQKIRTEFIWLKEDATTRADFTRADMPKVWADVLPRVKMLEEAHKLTNYPAKPGFLCRKWCPVTQCPHNGV